MASEELRRSQAHAPPHLAFLTRPTGDSAIDADLNYIRNLDWSKTALGSISSWPPELLALVNLAMLSQQPQLFLLGPELILLYNTAYGRLLYDHHPLYQGRPICLNTALITQASAIDSLVRHAKIEHSLANENHVPYCFPRHGKLEEVFLPATMIRLPLSLDGYHATAYNTTLDAVQLQRSDSLQRIQNACKHAANLPELWSSILKGISQGDGDIAFAVLYHAKTSLVDDQQTHSAHQEVDMETYLLAGTVGHFPKLPPIQIKPYSQDGWTKTLFKVVGTRDIEELRVDDGSLPDFMHHASKSQCYGDKCLRAIVIPSTHDSAANVDAVFIIGLAPRRPWDDSYQAWIRTLDQNLATYVATITLSEAMAITKADDNRRIAREKDILAKEVSTREQETALAADKVRRCSK